MKKELVEYFEKSIESITYNALKLTIVKNNEYSFEAILEANNCDIKIEESTKQIILSISKKGNDWISMYWISKYLNIPYAIIPIYKIKGNYDRLLTKQIDYCCNFIKNNIAILDDFFNKNVDKTIQMIRKNAKQNV